MYTASVTAVYPGDVLAGSSRETIADSVEPNPNPGTSSTVTCYAGQYCDSGTVTLVGTDGTTTLDVVYDPSAHNQTVMASLAPGPALHCSQSPAGDLADFSSTAKDAAKTVYYTVTGTLAGNVDTAYRINGGAFLGCYASSHEFDGYVGDVYGRAPRVIEPFGPTFEAQLATCSEGHLPPCLNVSEGEGVTEVAIQAPAGDPHATFP